MPGRLNVLWVHLLGFGKQGPARLGTSPREKLVGLGGGIFTKQGSCSREVAGAAPGSCWSCLWNLRKTFWGGSLPEVFIYSWEVYIAGGSRVLAQLGTEVPSLQLWQVLAFAKQVKLPCGRLGGVLPSFSSFCLLSTAEEGKGNTSP